MTLPEFTGIMKWGVSWKWGAPCLAVFARHGIAVVGTAAPGEPALSKAEGSRVARLALPDAMVGIIKFGIMRFSSLRSAA